MEIILRLKVKMDQVKTKNLCFEYFCRFVTSALNESINERKLTNYLKLATISPVSEQDGRTLKIIVDQ